MQWIPFVTPITLECETVLDPWCLISSDCSSDNEPSTKDFNSKYTPRWSKKNDTSPAFPQATDGDGTAINEPRKDENDQNAVGYGLQEYPQVSMTKDILTY